MRFFYCALACLTIVSAVVLGNVVSYLFFLLLVLNTLKNAIERYPKDKARVES